MDSYGLRGVGERWRIIVVLQYKIKFQPMSSQSHATYLEGHILRRFNVLKKVGSGAYGHVWKVEEKSTRKFYALKKIFDAFQHATDAQRTYRQIEILRQLQHGNVIRLYETMRAENNKDVYLLFEFMEADLHNVVAEGILKDVHIRFIIYQLAKALKYLHSARLIHRDLKPSNVLVNSNCTIKLCDFGLVRSLNQGKDSGAVLTEGVATRWYRSPQVLLGSKSYSTPADIWSFGCIVYEIISQKPLFPGSCTMDQLQKICSFTGYPTEEDVASLSSEIAKSMIKEMKISANSKPAGFLKDLPAGYGNLLEKILVFNPAKRLTIDEILNHEVVQAFHKPQEETVCTKEVSTGIDDNKKFTVDQYRKLIYGVNSVEPKPKALSASLGAGSVSPKYQPLINKSTITFSSVKNGEGKGDVMKKYSYDKIKPVSQGGNSEEVKKQQPAIKYVRSANNILKVESPHLPNRRFEPTQDIPNREETDPLMQHTYSPQNYQPVQQQFPPSYQQNPSFQPSYHKYVGYTRPEVGKFVPNTNVQPPSPSNQWKGKVSPTAILTSNEIKQKVLQFRSPKYISSGKSNLIEGKGQH